MKINNLLNINSFFPVKKESDYEKKQVAEVLNSDDNLSISTEAEDFHKLALKTNNVLNDIEKIQQDDISKIKDRLKNGYYSREEVLSEVASSILDKDEYQNLFMSDGIIGIVEEYVDLRETDIEKVKFSKDKVGEGFYNQEKIYNEVADDIINIYT